MTRWTTDQNAAIEAKVGPVLVSAAAGSGKTAVLVERVLRRLTDPIQPLDLDRFLLVTFTNAAASEMRAKLGAAMMARLIEEPENARLRRQMLLLQKADITTMHSYCMKLARENAQMLGIPSDFRLLDPSEAKQLRVETLQTLLDACYETADPAFLALSDLVSNGRGDDALVEILLEIDEKMGSHADPEGFAAFLRERLNGADLGELRAFLLAEAKEEVAYGVSLLEKALHELETDTEGTLADAYTPVLTVDFDRAMELQKVIAAGDWDTAVGAVRALLFDRMPTIRGMTEDPLKVQVTALRKEWKDQVENLKNRVLCAELCEITEDRGLTAPALCALVDTARAFSDAFLAEKKRRNAADFSDLEHFAVQLLGKPGKTTPLAQMLSARYDEVLVDEYQDTNGVQDAIFSALSDGGRKLFMVGDVKQSIYGFRLAEPRLFLERYRSYAEDSAPGEPRRIVLNRNFRSRPPVLDAVNAVFSRVMSERVGDLDYTEREALYPGAADPAPGDARYAVEVLLADSSTEKGSEKVDKAACEARLIADRIHQMVVEQLPIYDKAQDCLRPVEPGDIAILLRSPRRRASALRSALAMYGIPVRTEERTGLLATAEVGTIVSLLHIIDNPRQDVELIGVLRSPLFGFSEERLGEIRLREKTIPFYDALVLCAETDTDCAEFLQTLTDLRLLAGDLPVYRLIWEIYTRTGALGLFAGLPGGVQRRRNLLSFLDRARTFEQSSVRGLYHFVTLLRGMQENGEDFDVIRAEGDTGAVRILSIHKSKGLEYPVVILADCAGRFNRMDLTRAIQIHPRLGVAGKCRDLNRGIQYDTFDRRAFVAVQERENLSEELRVLYVAMTRARDKLILTGVSDKMESYIATCAEMGATDKPLPYLMAQADCFLDWVLTALIRHTAATAIREKVKVQSVPDLSLPDLIQFSLKTAAEILKSDAEQKENISRERRTVLPGIPAQLDDSCNMLIDLPAKLTATGMKTDFKSMETTEETRVPYPQFSLRRPDFDRLQTGLTPAERGTAHHLFFQFCDFDRCGQGKIAEEIERLREKRILTSEQADALDETRIARFFTSQLYQIFAQTTVRREFKFSVVVPACDYYKEVTDEKEMVLLQGVVDCLLETEEGFIILDFKTDRIRPEASALRAQTYASQLAAYAVAVEKIFARPVLAKKLFFLQTGQEVTVP